MIYIGIDPGKSGAIAWLNGVVDVDVQKNDTTEHDVAGWLFHIQKMGRCKAYIEQVSAMPKQGVSSTFKFGQSYGFLRGLLVAYGIPFETVTPAKWQGAMRCRTKGDKNVTKAAAQRLWPSMKITHATADALLIAEYGRRLELVKGDDNERRD